MASIPSTLALSSPSSLAPHHHLPFSLPPSSSPSSSTSSVFLSASVAFRPRPFRHSTGNGAPPRGLSVRAMTLDFSGSFFEGDRDEGPPGPTAAAAAATLEDKAEPQCPPGLRQYETMAVLRPDMSEDERLTFTQKYEELLVAGGGMYVEVFNRGVIPLAYSIKKRNKAGETNTYFDGIYLLFTYFTKPESMAILESRLKADDDVIRSSSFKIRKRKY